MHHIGRSRFSVDSLPATSQTAVRRPSGDDGRSAFRKGRLMRKRVLLPGAAISLLVSTATSGSAVARTADGSSPEPALPDPESSETRKQVSTEAEAYAADHDLSVDEAAERLLLQDNLGRTLGSLQELAGERFAGAWIDHVPDLTGTIRLTSDVPVEEFKELVDSSLVPIHVAVDAPVSIEATVAEAERLSPLVAEALPGTSTSVDERTGEIVLWLSPESSGIARQGTVAELQSRTVVPLRAVRSDTSAGDGNVWGGGRMNSANGNCTSGFTVRNNADVVGVLTAGHCPNGLTFADYIDGGSVGTTFRQEARSATADVQWHTPNTGTAPPGFYGSSRTTRREATGIRLRQDQPPGTFVCHQGRSTGYSCGDVASRFFSPGWANACPGTTCSHTWIQVDGESLECFPGDSGGPWFIGGTAYGIYKGQSSGGTSAADCNWAVYMAIDYKSEIGVGVKTV